MRTNGNDTRSTRVLAEEFDGQVVKSILHLTRSILIW